MSRPSIESLWDKLDPGTQEWLRANPGSVMLPRSVAEAILRAGGQPDSLEEVDRHGQFLLSPQDQGFIKAAAISTPVGHPVPPGAPPS